VRKRETCAAHGVFTDAEVVGMAHHLFLAQPRLARFVVEQERDHERRIGAEGERKREREREWEREWEWEWEWERKR
jgi:hypothetical protein